MSQKVCFMQTEQFHFSVLAMRTLENVSSRVCSWMYACVFMCTVFPQIKAGSQIKSLSQIMVGGKKQGWINWCLPFNVQAN